MPEVKTTGTVVKEFMIGNTRIKICNDAYINRTPEELEQTRKRLTDIGVRCVMSSSFNEDATDIHIDPPGSTGEGDDPEPASTIPFKKETPFGAAQRPGRVMNGCS